MAERIRTHSPRMECLGLARAYGHEIAVDDVSLTVPAGRICALIGLNGAGKSTLMRLLLGMARPDRGEVRMLGRSVASAPSSTWARVGHVVAGHALYPELTLAQNLTNSARLHGLSRSAAKRAVDDAVDLFVLSHWAHRRADTLSLGNRQRTALAAATLHRPAVLVLDEPTNGLDPLGMVLLREVVRDSAAGGAAVLVSSHHLDEVSRVADDIAVMHRGRLIGSLPAAGSDLESAFFAMVLAADTHGERRGPVSIESCGREHRQEGHDRTRA